jgi:4-phosphopantoate--beta-alanine ligase
VVDVPIVDNLVRAIPTMAEHARELRDRPCENLKTIVEGFDREAALAAAEGAIRSGATK